MTINVKFEMQSEIEILKARGLQNRGRVQEVIDSEVMRRMDKYTPFRSGYLKGSPLIYTQVGKGEIIQETPYARRHYYNFGKASFQGAPTRGSHWFERMKADHKDGILRTAAREAGARSD